MTKMKRYPRFLALLATLALLLNSVPLILQAAADNAAMTLRVLEDFTGLVPGGEVGSLTVDGVNKGTVAAAESPGALGGNALVMRSDAVVGWTGTEGWAGYTMNFAPGTTLAGADALLLYVKGLTVDAVKKVRFALTGTKAGGQTVTVTPKGWTKYDCLSLDSGTWGSKGLVADISGNRDIVAKANSAGGVPFAVLYADGQFTVWLNNERVASQVRPTDKEANIFADDAKVTAGLETWQYGASFTGLFIGSSRPVSRDWDLSRLEGEGTALCTTTDNYATAPLAVPASTRLYASADILLPYRDNDDTRAGFVFKDGQGGDVFVALTMVKKNDETGMPASYALQFISRGATSWAAEGDVLYLGGDAALAEAANSPEGARLEVLYHDGLFDVWVNYSKVATNIKAIADSRPVLAADAAVTVGLQSWSNKTTFYQVTMGRERPANAAWDLTELEDGTVKSRTTDISVAALGRAPGASVYVSSSITLPVVAYDDTRAGYRFTDSDGNNVFIALCMNKTNGPSPSRTITAPTGTSPSSAACRASSSARRM